MIVGVLLGIGLGVCVGVSDGVGVDVSVGVNVAVIVGVSVPRTNGTEPRLHPLMANTVIKIANLIRCFMIVTSAL